MWVVLAGAAYAASALLGGCGHSVDVTPGRTEVCKDGSCLVIEQGHISYSQAQPETDVPPVVQSLKSKIMCQPIDWVLRVVNTVRAVLDGKNGILTLLIVVLMSGFVGMALIYNDFKSFLAEQTKNYAIQTEVLRTIDLRLSNLEQQTHK